MLANYEQALLLIEKLEKQYGSIIKVPDSNPELQKIHRLLPLDRPYKNINYQRVRWLNRQGYSIAHIAQVTHHSKAAVNKYFLTYNIKPKRAFKYRVKFNSATVAYYGTSLIHLASLLLHKKFHDAVTAKRQLNAHGFHIRTNSYIWCQIPDGAYYSLSHSNHFAVKSGLDSYNPNA